MNMMLKEAIHAVVELRDCVDPDGSDLIAVRVSVSRRVPSPSEHLGAIAAVWKHHENHTQDTNHNILFDAYDIPCPCIVLTRAVDDGPVST